MKKELPLVSVILPVYNAEKFVFESINSIINQTYNNLQIIIINDGSVDNSLNIINSFNDQRIIVISRENKGLIYSLNEGLKHSKGNFILRMDADDIAKENRIERQLAEFRKKPHLSVVGSFCELIDEENNIIGYRTPPRYNFYIKSSCFFGSPFVHPSVMFNKRKLKEQLFYSEKYRYAEDYELWARLSLDKSIQFYNIPEYLLKYRILKTSVSRKNNEAQNNIKLKIQKEYFLRKINSSHEINIKNLTSIIFYQKRKIYLLPQILFILKIKINSFFSK